MNEREHSMAKVLEQAGVGYMLGEMYRFGGEGKIAGLSSTEPGGAAQGSYGEAQQLGIQGGNRISVSVVMFQKASQLRKQAEALSVLGRQLQEIEKRQSAGMRMGADLTDALMTVFR